ncbi:hypothetical protein HYFRA_00005890 [Hymenoscyphus fraxineus]|uniref:Uncharacterized protein n=1 Tax=Hymenoscyphus fraxineus TaxID=746836 RepID=A0A9N9KY63_9HELO|nr:hypothetical protein HYFRA_00005890 [Hymenoscyphus fraxineus]
MNQSTRPKVPHLTDNGNEIRVSSRPKRVSPYGLRHQDRVCESIRTTVGRLVTQHYASLDNTGFAALAPGSGFQKYWTKGSNKIVPGQSSIIRPTHSENR